jgi:N-acetylglutamate synthase-like GNAT family acetyltransferase
VTARVLRADEWPRVAHTEIGPALGVLPPGSQILVVEDGAEVAGCWALLPYYHVEGLWVAPAYRKRGAVLRRLIVGMRRLAQAVGVRAVWTGSVSDEVTGLLQHYGAQPIPGAHYAMPVGGGE